MKKIGTNVLFVTYLIKNKKKWQESLIFAFFFVSLPLKTINSYNYGKRKKRWQKNEQSATH